MARAKLSILIFLCLFIHAACASASSLTANQVIVSTGGSGTANSSITSVGANNGFDNTSPAYPIDVTGTGRFTNVVITSLSTGCVQSTNGILSSTGITCGSGGGGGNPAGTTGQYQYNNGGIFAAGNMLYTDGTNVGINQTTPVYQLDVNGVAHATSFTGAGTGLMGTASGLSIGGNAATATTATSATTATTATNFSGSLVGDVTGTQGATSVVKVNGLSVPTSKTIVGTNSSGQFVDASSAALSNNTSGNAATVTTNANLTGAITSVGNAVSNNFVANIGIGSAAPGQVLDVNGTVRAIAHVVRGGTSSQFQKGDGSLDSTSYYAASNPSAYISNVGIGTVNDITYWAGTNVIGALNTSTYPSLTELSYVKGVTSAIQTQLNTKGTSSAVGANPTGTIGLSAVNGSSANFVRADGAPALSQAIIPTWTATHTFNGSPSIITSGNVGVGSASPGQQLDVNGTTRTSALYITGLTGGRPLILNSNNGIATGFYTGNTTTQVTSTGALIPGDYWKIDANGNAIDGGTGVTPAAGSTGYVQYNNANSFAGSANFVFSGNNVGISSLSPGQNLDVGGTVRTINFTMSGQTPVSGYVLTASDSAGDTYWASITNQTTGTNLLAGNGSGGFTNVTNSGVSGANVGIGTSTSLNAALEVNGNVGIGTFNTITSALVVQGNIVTQGSFSPSYFTASNVGIGSISPGQILDVQGTVRTTGFQLNLVPLASGNVLVSNNVGLGTWMPPSTIGAGGGGSGTINSGLINQFLIYPASGTTIGGQSVLTTDTTNIGIGTTGPSSLLDVNRKLNVLSSGNIGIGSLTPGQVLDVNGGIRSTSTATSNFSSNVGIGSLTPGQALDVQGTVRAINFYAVGIGTASPTRVCFDSVNGITKCP